MKITLTNDFHSTSVTVRAHVLLGEAVLTPGQVSRVRNALCGVMGCSCSGVLGARGPQTDIESAYQSHPDMSVTLFIKGQQP